jgi:hypothetical protein
MELLFVLLDLMHGFVMHDLVQIAWTVVQIAS